MIFKLIYHNSKLLPLGRFTGYLVCICLLLFIFLCLGVKTFVDSWLSAWLEYDVVGDLSVTMNIVGRNLS